MTGPSHALVWVFRVDKTASLVQQRPAQLWALQGGFPLSRVSPAGSGRIESVDAQTNMSEWAWRLKTSEGFGG